VNSHSVYHANVTHIMIFNLYIRITNLAVPRVLQIPTSTLQHETNIYATQTTSNKPLINTVTPQEIKFGIPTYGQPFALLGV